MGYGWDGCYCMYVYVGGKWELLGCPINMVDY